ncbi:MAG: Unknown protein [uncultured Thiotrichaceae bacterium]|uniref:SH3b domain-containing protein n=1 Tax=uncultured Thiotrichaceae bacterium TaxID=298394 RepID=A0A6S6UFB1_9GAMM|nr:MAG: Unknown protein [uncultured Thiotrichaceae bacterium]
MKKLSIYTATSILFLSFLFFSEVIFAKNTVKIYKVCKVKSGQHVTLYKDPTKHSAVVAKLPHDCKWIKKQKGKKKFSHSRWQKITWDNKSGWLRNSCLELDKKHTKIVMEKPYCLEKETRTEDCQ